MAGTETIRRQLRAEGVGHVAPWGRGVDLAQFRPNDPPLAEMMGLPRPIHALGETVGAMDVDLNRAIERALTRERGACAAYTARFEGRARATSSPRLKARCP